MTGPEPSLKLPAKGKMPSYWRREVELNDAASQLFNLKFEVQKLLCRFFPCRGTKKEQDCLVSVHLRLLSLSPHLSFGGRWEGMKNYNTTIWMLNHSLVELEKLCKISQENAALCRGLLTPILCWDRHLCPAGAAATLWTEDAWLSASSPCCMWPWKLAKSPWLSTVLSLKIKIKNSDLSESVVQVLWGWMRSQFGSRVTLLRGTASHLGAAGAALYFI